MLDLLRSLHQLGAATLDTISNHADLPSLDAAVERGLVRLLAWKRGPGVYRLTRRGHAILTAAQRNCAAA